MTSGRRSMGVTKLAAKVAGMTCGLASTTTHSLVYGRPPNADAAAQAAQLGCANTRQAACGTRTQCLIGG